MREHDDDPRAEAAEREREDRAERDFERGKTERWSCPLCGAPAMNRDDLCSGTFVDSAHPSNVRPVRDA